MTIWGQSEVVGLEVIRTCLKVQVRRPPPGQTESGRDGHLGPDGRTENGRPYAESGGPEGRGGGGPHLPFIICDKLVYEP